MAPLSFPRLALYAGLAAVVTLGAFSLGSHAAEDSAEALAPGEIKAIEQVIERYLQENPEVLIRALRTYQESLKLAEEERQQQQLVSSRAALQNDPGDPIMGNPDGDVVMVEFFDYRCPYCKRIASSLKQSMAEDGKIKMVMKEYPILGPDSVYAAKASVAASKQGKYEEFHFGLLLAPGKVTRKSVLAVAENIGLDMDRLKEDMESTETQEYLDRTRALGQALGVSGTPALVISDRLIPGAVDLAEIRRLIAQARANAS